MCHSAARARTCYTEQMDYHIPPRPPSPKHPTLLAMALSVGGKSAWPSIIEQIDWQMPDVGRASVLLNSHQWGSEVLYVHPLSTLARCVDEATFLQCLEQAHQQQGERMDFKVGERGNMIDLSNWVDTGVLSAVARHGTPRMLKALVQKLLERDRLTSNVANFPDRLRNGANPVDALARGSTDYRRKMKLLGDLIKGQAAAMFLAPKGVSVYARRLGRKAEANLYGMGLKSAIQHGNEEMFEVVVASKKASMDLDVIDTAASYRHMDMLVRAGSALGWDLDWDDMPRQLPPLLSALRHHAWYCLEAQFPGTLAKQDQDRARYFESFDAPAEHAAGLTVVLELIKDLPQQIRDIPQLGTELSALGRTLAPVFMALPEDRVEEAWSLLENISKAQGLEPARFMWMPETATMISMSQHPDNPWVRRILRAIEELPVDQARDFLAEQHRLLRNHWSSSSANELREGAAERAIPGVALWWSHLPPGTTDQTIYGWMGSAHGGRQEIEFTLRQIMLDRTAQDASPAQRAVPRPRQM